MNLGRGKEANRTNLLSIGVEERSEIDDIGMGNESHNL